jgi:hypothetical protein
MDDLLAGSSEVPWDTMYHCRGSAGDIPVLLRGMMLPDPAARAQAAELLWDAIQYQGSIFEPTAHVVPYLWRMAALAPDRGKILGMLAHLCDAYTMTEGQGLIASRFAPAPDSPEGMEVAAQYARELAWVANVKAALAACDWDGLLGDADPDIRIYAGYAVAKLLGNDAPSQRHADRLATRMSAEADPRVQASLVYALACTGDVVHLRAALQTAQRPGRVVAAMYLLSDEPAAADELIAALRDRQEHHDWFARPFPWLSRHFRFQAIGMLCRAPDAAFSAAVPVLSEIIRHDASAYTCDSDVAPPIVRALTGHLPPSPLPADARVLVQAMVDNGRILGTKIGNVGIALRPTGLPDDPVKWKVLLALSHGR